MNDGSEDDTGNVIVESALRSAVQLVRERDREQRLDGILFRNETNLLVRAEA